MKKTIGKLPFLKESIDWFWLTWFACPVLVYWEVFGNGKSAAGFPGADSIGRDPHGGRLVHGATQLLHWLFKKYGFVLWEPSEAAGRPILGDPHYKLMNPFQWLGMLAPNPTWITTLLMGKMFLSYALMYALLRKLKIAPMAALLGSVAWIGNGYFAGYISHNHFDIYLAFPGLFLGIELLRERSWVKGILCFEVFLYLVLSGGNPQPAIGVLACTVGYLAFVAMWERSFKILGAGVLSLTLAVLIDMPEILGALELKSLIYYGARNLSHNSPRAALVLLYRWFLPLGGPYVDNPDEAGASFSFLILVLSLGFLPQMKKTPAVFWTFAVVCFSLYLTFEHQFFLEPPLRALLNKIPVVCDIRYSKYFDCFFFAVCVLFGFAAQAFFDSRQSKYSFVWTFLVWGAALWVVVDAMTPSTNRGLLLDETLLNEKHLAHYSVLLVFTALLFLIHQFWPRKKAKSILAGILLLFLLLELDAAKWPCWHLPYRNQHPGAQTRFEEQLNVLVGRPKDHQPFRLFDLDNHFMPALARVTPAFQQLQGAFPLQLAHYDYFYKEVLTQHRSGLNPGHNLIGPLKNDLLNNPILPMLNVKYYVVEKETVIDTRTGRFKRLLSQLYEDRASMARAFVVDNAQWFPDFKEAANAVSKTPMDFSKKAFLVGEIPSVTLTTSGPLGARVSFSLYTPEEVHIDAESNKPAFLILTDAFHPGWRARVNDQEVPIFLAQGAFRAVAIPAGKSEISFHFVSRPWRVGIVFSLVGILLTLTIALFPKFKRKKS